MLDPDVDEFAELERARLRRSVDAVLVDPGREVLAVAPGQIADSELTARSGESFMLTYTNADRTNLG